MAVRSLFWLSPGMRWVRAYGRISHDQGQLSQMGPRGIGEVMPDAANVAINGMRLSMGNGS